MPLPPASPAVPSSGRRWFRAGLVGLGLALLASCGGAPAQPRAEAPAAPAGSAGATVRDRAAVVLAAPAARFAGPQATRAGARAPAGPAVPPPAPRAGPAVVPVAAAPPAPAPPAPTAEEIWAQERARHRAPRAWYGETPPRKIDCLHLKCIALTFDDGPGPGTDDLLEMLARHRARATFFVQGRNVREDPAPLIRAVWDGHEIGNHTWDHRSLVGRSTADIARDLLRTSDVIARAAGVRPTLVRPPFGAVDASTAGRVPAPLVLWSVDTDDWKVRDPALVTARVLERAGPGSVVLLHDVYRESVQAVPAILDHFQRDGYVFVTVSELFGGKLEPGREYRGREVAVQRARAADREAGRVRTLPQEYAPPSPGRLGGPADPTGQEPFPGAPTEPAPLEPGEIDPQRGTPDAASADPAPADTAPADAPVAPAGPGSVGPGADGPRGAADPSAGAAPPAPPEPAHAATDGATPEAGPHGTDGRGPPAPGATP